MKQNPRSNVYECFLRLLWLISVFTMITVASYVSNGKAVYAAEVKMPAFSGYPYTEVNENRPFFGTRDYTLKVFETYDELDNLGRCGKAFANVSSETMPTEERGYIGLIKPSGWNQVKYDGIVDTDPPYLYNRVHLIGWQLSGENANERNLITGTRYLNIEGMLPFESRIADYVKKTKRHVIYRVTPMFKGDNLLASGVLLEASSVEDRGQGLSFCVYCFNVQPGVKINYADGSSSADGSFNAKSVRENHKTVSNTVQPSGYSGDSVSDSGSMNSSKTSISYIGNKNSKKFHYPYCSSVDDMKNSNKVLLKDREEAVNYGYAPCKRCNP